MKHPVVLKYLSKIKNVELSVMMPKIWMMHGVCKVVNLASLHQFLLHCVQHLDDVHGSMSYRYS